MTYISASIEQEIFAHDDNPRLSRSVRTEDDSFESKLPRSGDKGPSEREDHRDDPSQRSYQRGGEIAQAKLHCRVVAGGLVVGKSSPVRHVHVHAAQTHIRTCTLTYTSMFAHCALLRLVHRYMSEDEVSKHTMTVYKSKINKMAAEVSKMRAGPFVLQENFATLRAAELKRLLRCARACSCLHTVHRVCTAHSVRGGWWVHTVWMCACGYGLNSAYVRVYKCALVCVRKRVRNEILTAGTSHSDGLAGSARGSCRPRSSQERRRRQSSARSGSHSAWRTCRFRTSSKTSSR